MNFNTYEIDRLLDMLCPEQLQKHKEELCAECQELAKQHIEADDSWGLQHIKNMYDNKMYIIKRILTQETLNDM